MNIQEAPARSVLFLGDLAAFLLFTCLGKEAHHLPVSLTGVFATAAPFWLTWVAVGTLLGVYRPQAYVSIGRAARSTVFAWSMAAPLAVWIRSILLDTPVTLLFTSVAYGIMLLFLLAWRVPFAMFAGRCTRL
ncbi:DUF3054 domain-containing protein [Brevibacillus sp. H7]|uniref:DUF3054 domain-containing protein n=1 Tax=Brevibacillus sp. H7 TaxID=3349138 RepID=UPI0037F29FB7